MALSNVDVNALTCCSAIMAEPSNRLLPEPLTIPLPGQLLVPDVPAIILLDKLPAGV